MGTRPGAPHGSLREWMSRRDDRPIATDATLDSGPPAQDPFEAPGPRLTAWCRRQVIWAKTFASNRGGRERARGDTAPCGIHRGPMRIAGILCGTQDRRQFTRGRTVRGRVRGGPSRPAARGRAALGPAPLGRVPAPQAWVRGEGRELAPCLARARAFPANEAARANM